MMDLWLFSFDHDGPVDWLWWIAAWVCWIGGGALMVAPVIVGIWQTVLCQ
jgi:hypothetical protein